MKNVVTVIFLLLVITVIGLYIVCYISFNLWSETNIINRTYRRWFLTHETLRNLLRLHQPGDARFRLTDTQISEVINVQVFYQDGWMLETNTIPTVIREMKRVLPTAKHIIFQPPKLLGEKYNEVNDSVMRALSRSPIKETGFSVRVFVLPLYSPHPTYVGMVENDTDMFLFKESILDFSHNQLSPLDMEVSTVLHEFSHLLGAEHTDVDGCILSASVEDYTFYNLPAVLTTSFCDSDIEEIQKAISY